MLLLFWHPIGSVVGQIKNLSWLHLPSSRPFCLCGAEAGFSVVNPYMLHPEGFRECSYGVSPEVLSSPCYYDGEILAGTNNGVYSVAWDLAGADCDVENPRDISSDVSIKYNALNGLLSDAVVSIDAQGNYLGVLTTSGLGWLKTGSPGFINYLTTSGNSVYVSSAPKTYLADGNTLRIKNGEPISFDSWDIEVDLGLKINDVWVSRDTIFLATVSGLTVIEGDLTYTFTNISGSQDILSVRTEYDTNYNWGHAFTTSSGEVNIINLKSKNIEQVLTYSGMVIMAADYPRLYSK